MDNADFSGYASKSGIRCTDGRTIMAHAFKDKDKTKIPLVWQHQHDGPSNILGHAFIEDRPDGTYTYGFFNDTEAGKQAKALVQHGDVEALSIFANRLEHQGSNVVHGNLVEVSLVLAGANPGAWIENVTLEHGDRLEELETDATLFMPTSDVHLLHADGSPIDVKDEEDMEGTLAKLAAGELDDPKPKAAEPKDEDDEEEDVEDIVHSMTPKQKAVLDAYVLDAHLQHADEPAGDNNSNPGGTVDENATIQDVLDGLPEETQQVVYYTINQLVEEAKKEATSSAEAAHAASYANSLSHSQEGSTLVNVFDQTLRHSQGAPQQTLAHSDVKSMIEQARAGRKLSEVVLAHAEAGDYGITNIDLLFPDAKTVGAMPNVISRQADWVPKVLDGTKQTPFAKIKSIAADLTEDEARAKGYITGKLKKDEVFSLLKRETAPTTVYKKQRLDRDHILDITDFDVVAWLKWEIRFMLNEELARAILVGDGRDASSEDKIKDPAGSVDGIGIRSIANDHELFAVPIQLDANVSDEDIIDRVAYAHEEYRGSGNPTFFTTNRTLTSLLLLKDKVGRRLYDTEVALAAALRVKEIVAVPVMSETPDLLGIIVNLSDYSVGTNRGGELTFFEDFDIDFNQNKYLLETRISGALTVPKSAIVLRRNRGTERTTTAPTFTDNKITIPTTAGVTYRIDGEPKTGTVTITEDTTVRATADEGSYIKPGSTTTWSFTYTA